MVECELFDDDFGAGSALLTGKYDYKLVGVWMLFGCLGRVPSNNIQDSWLSVTQHMWSNWRVEHRSSK